VTRLLRPPQRTTEYPADARRAAAASSQQASSLISRFEHSLSHIFLSPASREIKYRVPSITLPIGLPPPIENEDSETGVLAAEVRPRAVNRTDHGSRSLLAEKRTGPGTRYPDVLPGPDQLLVRVDRDYPLLARDRKPDPEYRWAGLLPDLDYLSHGAAALPAQTAPERHGNPCSNRFVSRRG
jgi:hypothetical protein